MRHTYLLSLLFLLLTATVYAQGESVTLSIAEGSPGNDTFFFECVPSGFNTTEFDWDFDDTIVQQDIPGFVSHKYVEDGEYLVKCSTEFNGTTLSDTLLVEVDFFNETDGVGNQTPNTTGAVDLSVAAGYPQNNTYLLICDPTDFDATSYNWNLGDGTVLSNVTQGNITHNYTPGSYVASCTAMGANVTGSDTLAITVANQTNVTNQTNNTGNQSNTTNQTGNLTNGTATLAVAPGFPQNNSYVFVCNATGFTPTRYDWHFGDGAILANTTNQDIYHTFASTGNYTVSCMASDNNNTANASLLVNVGGNVTPPTNNTGNQTNNTGNQTGNQTNNTGNQTGNASLDIAAWYPQGSNYVFVCNIQGFTPTNYTWYYGDGQKLIGIHNRDTFHHYSSTGTFNVNCSGTDGVNFASASRTVTVTNVTAPNPTPPQQNMSAPPGCFVDLEDVPAVCNGGTIVNDTDQVTFDNCRHTTCTNGNETLTVLSCEKPDEIYPLFFEMYKIQDTGNLEICLGNTCIKDNGFARSGQFPYCPGNQTGNQTNNTGNQTGNQTNVTFGQVHIMKHSCPANITSVADLQALGANAEEVCQTSILPIHQFSPNTTHANMTTFGFGVMGGNGVMQTLNNAVFVQEKMCNGIVMPGANSTNATDCMDVSHYVWSNVANGMIGITEDVVPSGMRFGAMVLENGTMLGNPGIIDSNADNDNITMVHVYNFVGTNQTNDTGGGGNQTGNQTTQTVRLAIMKHLCPANIQSEADVQALGGFIQQEIGCPTTVLPQHSFANESAIHSNKTAFNFIVTGGGPAQNISNAQYHAEQVCFPAGNTTQCAEISHYEFNVTRGTVTVHETPAPGTRFGRFIFTPPAVENNTANQTFVNVDAGNGNIVLDLSRTNDTEVMIHVYNFVNTNGSTGGNQSGNQTNNTGNQTGNQTNVTNTSASIMTGFPLVQYNFTCAANGFTPTGYMWNFGDGTSVNNSNMNMTDTVSHVFTSNGLFMVMCQPMGGNTSAVMLPILVNVSNNVANTTNGSTGGGQNVTNQTGGVDLMIAPGFPQNNSVVLVCNATGFAASSYDWHFGDGTHLYNLTNADIYHTYPSAGSYNASCTAYGSGVSGTDTLQVAVGGATNNTGNQTGNQSNLTGDALNLGFAFSGPVYTLMCTPNTSVFNPTSFAWNFGDGTTQTTSSANVTHTFIPGSTYNVTCAATAGNTTYNDWVQVAPGGSLNNVVFGAALTPSQEVPPVNDSNATGSASAQLNGTMLTVNGTFAGLSSDLFVTGGSSAHVHMAPPGVAGPVVFPLNVTSADNRSGTYSGSVNLTQEQLEDFVAGQHYVNVHTVTHSGGEIRGQLNATT